MDTEQTKDEDAKIEPNNKEPPKQEMKFYCLLCNCELNDQRQLCRKSYCENVE